MSILQFAKPCLLIAGAAVLWGSAALAQAQQPAATSVGPGKVTCRSATACELTIGSPVSLRYKIDASAVPAADKQRLTGDCKPNGKPCIATVQGTEGAGGLIKATAVKFYN